MDDQDARDLGHAAPRRAPAERVRAWFGSPSPRAVDVLVFLAVAVPTTGASLATRVDKGPTLIVVLFALAATLPLLVRRRWPFAVLACIVIAAVLSPAGLPYVLPLIVGLYTIGAHRSWKAAIAAYCAVVLTALAYALAGGTRFDPVDVIPIALLGAIAAGAGIYIGSKRTSITTLEGATERLVREQPAARRARRRRGARSDRPGAPRRDRPQREPDRRAGPGAGRDPRATNRSRQATEGIADLGRRTMAEMHRTLRLLRAGDDAPSYLPQPGLGDLDNLLAQSRAAGRPGRARGRGRAAPAGAERRPLSVPHRAGGAHQRRQARGPRAHRGDDHLRARGAGAHDRRQRQRRQEGRRGAPGGHGLIGMRERTALFGGTLTAGPRPGQGFEVHASLPYDERIA